MRLLITGGSGFIGTNLTKVLHERGIQFINVDIAKPKESFMNDQWRRCDILDYENLLKIFKEFQPTALVHLAAETDTDPRKTLEDYKVNTEGTLNIINAIKSVTSIQRAIFTSTQFVNQSKLGPQHDEDFAPHTIYGESKIINEKQVRNANLECAWTIIRPTNVWGPWHLRYPYEFWKILAEKKYFHPGRKPVVRSYGYVGNVVDQTLRILELTPAFVHGKVYYVGDRPIDLYDWVNGFSVKQTGKNAIVLPRQGIYFLALIGDLLGLLNIKFPITRSRYRSMTTDNPVDMEKTFKELGENKYTLEQGIDETINWMKTYHPELVIVNQ